jgi:hypothetical protein
MAFLTLVRALSIHPAHWACGCAGLSVGELLVGRPGFQLDYPRQLGDRVGSMFLDAGLGPLSDVVPERPNGVVVQDLEVL